MNESYILLPSMMGAMSRRRIQHGPALGMAALLIAVSLAIGPHASFAQTPASKTDTSSDSSSATTSSYPSGKLGATVRLGETLVQQTSQHPLSKPFVGNSLNCTSCHLESGKHESAASFIGVATAYPAYSPREQKVITLEDRILNCFIRSQNGTRPPNGSEVPVAIATYITWLSEGLPLAMNPVQSLGPNHLTMLEINNIQPNLKRGMQLYAERCADCHSDDGLGTDEGPPVWGDDSFNDGAGLSKIPKMAAWLKVAMPLDDTDLTDQESFDIAAFINSHPRPTFRPTESK